MSVTRAEYIVCPKIEVAPAMQGGVPACALRPTVKRKPERVVGFYCGARKMGRIGDGRRVLQVKSCEAERPNRGGQSRHHHRPAIRSATTTAPTPRTVLFIGILLGAGQSHALWAWLITVQNPQSAIDVTACQKGAYRVLLTSRVHDCISKKYRRGRQTVFAHYSTELADLE